LQEQQQLLQQQQATSEDPVPIPVVEAIPEEPSKNNHLILVTNSSHR
jgi:hypothetical protein